MLCPLPLSKPSLVWVEEVFVLDLYAEFVQHQLFILVTALVIAIILESYSSGKVDSVLDNGMTLADVQYWGRVDVRAHLFRLKRIYQLRGLLKCGGETSDFEFFWTCCLVTQGSNRLYWFLLAELKWFFVRVILMGRLSGAPWWRFSIYCARLGTTVFFNYALNP